MNIQISARTFPNTAALLANAAAVRHRLLHPNSARPVAPVAPPAKIVTRRNPRQQLHFHDAHVLAFRRWHMIAASGPCTLHILKRCAEEGLPYEIVTGPSRKRAVTHLRQMLMWELKTIVQPDISYPAIGRLFGGRDHTTCLWAVRAHAARIVGKES